MSFSDWDKSFDNPLQYTQTTFNGNSTFPHMCRNCFERVHTQNMQNLANLQLDLLGGRSPALSSDLTEFLNKSTSCLQVCLKLKKISVLKAILLFEPFYLCWGSYLELTSSLNWKIIDYAVGCSTSKSWLQGTNRSSQTIKDKHFKK